MPYYLGIDGGGTKTRCLLADETTVLAKAMTGGSNIVRLGEMQAREALHTAIRQVCATARISPDQIRAVCIGAAGAARPEIAAKIRSILAELIPGNKYRKRSHQHRSCRRHRDRPRSRFRRRSGSDRNRRHRLHRLRPRRCRPHCARRRLGVRHLRRRLRPLDRPPRHLRYPERLRSRPRNHADRLVLQAWKLTTIDELVQQANSTPPPDFPRLFPIVLRAADAADAIARDLLADAGAKLANLAAIVVRRLAPHAPVSHAPRGNAPRGNDGQRLSSVPSMCARFSTMPCRQAFPESTCVRI